jgi:formate dehydrogenase subunit gamma
MSGGTPNGPSFPPTADMAAVIDAIVARFAGRPGPLLEILHAVQGQLGCVPKAAVPLIADRLNLSRAEVHGVITFYHHFREQPRGRHTVQICHAEACQSMHVEQLAKHAEQILGVGFHETTLDGAFTLEPVYCLGNCACAPAMLVDGELHGRVTPSRFDEVIAATIAKDSR